MCKKTFLILFSLGTLVTVGCREEKVQPPSFNNLTHFDLNNKVIESDDFKIEIEKIETKHNENTDSYSESSIIIFYAFTNKSNKTLNSFSTFNQISSVSQGLNVLTPYLHNNSVVYKKGTTKNYIGYKLKNSPDNIILNFQMNDQKLGQYNFS